MVKSWGRDSDVNPECVLLRLAGWWAETWGFLTLGGTIRRKTLYLREEQKWCAVDIGWPSDFKLREVGRTNNGIIKKKHHRITIKTGTFQAVPGPSRPPGITRGKWPIIPIGSMYAIYGNIYHQYTPNVSIYTIHGSYGIGHRYPEKRRP